MNHQHGGALPAILRAASTADAEPTEQELLAIAEQLAATLRADGAAQPPAELHPVTAQARYEALQATHALADGLPRYALSSNEIARLPFVDQALHELGGMLSAHTLHVVIPQREGTWAVLSPATAQAVVPTVRRLLALRILAQAGALMGVPMQLDTGDGAQPTVLHTMRQVVTNTGDDTLLVVPWYEWSGSTPRLCAVIVAERHRVAVPLTELRWWCWFAQSGEAAISQRLQATRVMRECVPVEVREAGAAPAWDTHVTVLRREAIPWLPPPRVQQVNGVTQLDTSSFLWLRDVTQWLGAIIQELGIAQPSADQQPAVLKKRLQQVMSDHEAERVSSSAETSATTLRNSATESGRTATSRAMVEQLRGLLDTAQYPFTGFASYHGDGQFVMRTALEEPLAEREAAVLALAAQVAALHGAQTFVPPDVTPTPVHALIRTVLESHDGLLVIPVYSWRSTGEPMELFGAFVAVRDGAAPPPDAKEMVQWNLVCQAMDAPLTTLALQRDPIDRQATLAIQPAWRAQHIES